MRLNDVFCNRKAQARSASAGLPGDAKELFEDVRQVLGRDAQFICSPGTYDQKHIDRVGKLKDCIAYGPGRLDLAHQPDEYVLIDDMVASAKVMALAAWSLLNAPA